MNKQKIVPFKFGIGLASSECYMGTIGSDEKRAWKSIGKSLSISKTLSQLALSLNMKILIDQSIHDVLPKVEFQRRIVDYLFEETTEIEVYQLISQYIKKNDEWIYELKDLESSSWANEYNSAIDSMKQGKLDEAIAYLKSFQLKNCEDKPSQQVFNLIYYLNENDLTYNEYLEQQKPENLPLGTTYT
eukprot:CAMPEP_0117431622 /NCGR_PEP_ID=MMETSP0758-20121206/11148_1 /TAXON_ID=63605 /ORGANISM="Percolomonas cosmopolitus, Strain AE-1 (ATCC 50343)" /LENGTH=187 /DNA_ID=CAMNT_0005220799 /DNA_START=321 /DNA_END=881 /DNA_ORIENTATION=+